MMQKENLLNLQYILFCSHFVESPDQVSIIGLLDGADVRGTVKRGDPVPDKVFPLKLVLGINAPPGSYQVKLVITKPSGGVSTTVDLEEFHISKQEYVHRCVASLDMEVSEDGLYEFSVFVGGINIGKTAFPMSFVVEFED